MEPKKITGPWYLKTANFPKTAGKVFSCFACTGGSTMGYKLAGFDVIGMNEIDPRVAEVYKANHKPKYAFVSSIREIIDAELPEELFNLDILDGSPPCSTFSMSGSREDAWGKEKKFAEGQAKQRLDDLFFSYIELGKRLQPKVIVAENVLGMLLGKAKGYIKEIYQELDKAGYNVQLFKMNSANMGVPQARGRVFFIAHRKDLNLKKINLKFEEQPISFKEIENIIIEQNLSLNDYSAIPPSIQPYYHKVKPGKSVSTVHPKGNFFNWIKVSYHKPVNTLSSKQSIMHPKEPRTLTENELTLCSSFPMDMNWLDWKLSKKWWAMGMSVPPFMVQRIALEIKNQWGHVFHG
jgi:DNA (cytosine-5)-methyltransferase 1